TKPIEWEKVSSAVRRQLEAPVKPKPQFIPAIDASNGIYRHYREDFLFLQKIKNRMKIELFTLGATPNIPDEETISITKHQSFEKFAKYMISPEEKELLRCNDVTIVNANKIIKVSKIDHYLLLKGCEKKIPIDPAYRKHIYSMFRD
ncbi:MAG: hypothetical protein FWE07_05390, partial [Turicibacter sp.]|nr:hypothetical protein [Turicibacter sp.]